MDVVDLLADIVLGSEISVVSAAALPETVLTTAVRLPVRHAFEEGGTLVLDPVKGTLGDRGFDRVENPADLDASVRQQDQMDVLGHEDVAP